MKIHEILEGEEFEKIRNEVDIFAERLLKDYTQNLSDRSSSSAEKEIFDAVWGPVEFNAGEIALLDSPLIQRLRKIKQLGLASYVYCGADYSRFSHTIGVFYLSDKMAEIIHKKIQGEEKYNFTQIVRLAAIFHDAGHMFFSHVSERYFTDNRKFKRYEEVKKIIKEMSKKVNTSVSFHEILGVILVQSPAVKALIKKIAPRLDNVNIITDDDLEQIVEYISCLILGQATDEQILPYHQIINGPVDADKCDYLSRDSHATNVPVAVDIFRLIHKLNVEKIKIPEDVYDAKIWEGDIEQEAYYPTIKSSAVEALSQLVMARAIMYNSVYYHQKVRTAEMMLEKVLEELGSLEVSGISDFTKILLLTDDAFGYYCYQIFSNIENVNKSDLKSCTKNLDKINLRVLLKRACTIDRSDIIASEEKSYDFEKYILKLQEQNTFQEIEEKAQEEYKIICDYLGILPEPEITFLILGFPSKVLGNSIPDAVISYGNGEVKRAAEIFQTGTWMESRDS